MPRSAAKVVGVVLALLGLVLTGAGSWFAAHLGGTGTATFTARPGSATPLLIDPSILNRIDGPVRVTATGAAGSTVWMGLAAPSDAAAVVGSAERLVVTGVSVRDWSATTRRTGNRSLDAARTADVWQRHASSRREATLTVRQAQAPQTLLIDTGGGDLETVTISWVHKAWFVQAIVSALLGLALLAGGALLLWPRAGGSDSGSAAHSSRLGVAA